MIFTCPQCRREKDFGDTHIPPLGRSYRCPCGLSTVVRPSWSSNGQKVLSSAGPKPPEGASPEQQLVVGVPVDAVRARLGEPAVRKPAPPPPAAPAPKPAAAGVPTAADIEKLFPAKTWTPEPDATAAAPTPTALKSRPLGFIEVGPSGPDAPVVRAPVRNAPAMPAVKDPADPTAPSAMAAPEPPTAPAVRAVAPAAPAPAPRPVPRPAAAAPAPAAARPVPRPEAAPPAPARPAPRPEAASPAAPPPVNGRARWEGDDAPTSRQAKVVLPVAPVEALAPVLEPTGEMAPVRVPVRSIPPAVIRTRPAPEPEPFDEDDEHTAPGFPLRNGASAPPPARPGPAVRAPFADDKTTTGAALPPDADGGTATGAAALSGDATSPAMRAVRPQVDDDRTATGAASLSADATSPAMRAVRPQMDDDRTATGAAAIPSAPPPLPSRPGMAPVRRELEDRTDPALHRVRVERGPPPPAVRAPAAPELDEDTGPPGPRAPAATDTGPAPAASRPLGKRVRGALWKMGLGAAFAFAGFGWWELHTIESQLPPLDAIKNYRPPIVTEIRSPDGQVIGKFFDEERYVVEMKDVPDHVKHAFLAAEDADFYSHSGLDYGGMARALFKDLVKGGKVQGASTITQQVARTFLLTRQKTWKRKVAEILLARRIEKQLSKDEILHRYLNQIFFGHGIHAYGVEAASRVYFGKHVQDLSIAEAALLAGLPQAPSSYSPDSHPKEALRRRAYVLDQMEKHGWITHDQRVAADAEELHLSSMPDPTRTLTPFFTEEVKRELIDEFGKDVVDRDGLQVTATVDVALQQTAQDSVVKGLGVLDHRIGYRPATDKADLKNLDAALKALGDHAPATGETVKGIVTDVSADHVFVALPGGALGVIHRVDNLWVYPIVPEAWWKTHVASDLSKVIQPGDVIDVQPMDPKDSKFLTKSATGKLADKIKGRLILAVVQQPEVQGALLSFHLPDGRVMAMVGGQRFDKSEFLRPMQAHRQVGSTFKTFVYAAALSKKDPPGTPADQARADRFTLATILQDAPIVMTAHEAELKHTGPIHASDDEWKPGNFNEKYYGDTPLRTAFVLSRNLPTIQLAQKVGIRDIISFARKLGIESDLPPDLSIALGSASLTLFELCRAHAVFPSGGVAVQPHFIEMVKDRDGKVLFDLKSELEKKPAQVVDPKVAFVMTQLMIDVARSGTATDASKLKRVVGGKTGTTNDYNDAWFVGFTPNVLTGVWVGYDQLRSLGTGETGGEAALPIWVDYMQAATKDQPDARFSPPEGVVKLKIDRASGLLARPDEAPEEMIEMWFVRGTEPTQIAMKGKINDEPNIFEADPGIH